MEKVVCGTAGAKTSIAIHNRLTGPFRPTESCIESLCTSAFDPWLVASDSSVIDPIVFVDRLQRLAYNQTFQFHGRDLRFLHSHVSCVGSCS